MGEKNYWLSWGLNPDHLPSACNQQDLHGRGHTIRPLCLVDVSNRERIHVLAFRYSWKQLYILESGTRNNYPFKHPRSPYMYVLGDVSLFTLGYSITSAVVDSNNYPTLGTYVCEISYGKSISDSLREAVPSTRQMGKKKILAQLGIEPRSPPLCL